MIDVLAMLEAFAHVATHPGGVAPLLRCKAEWRCRGGEGVAVGLVDGKVDRRVPDLAGATLIERCFAPTHAVCPAIAGHGTHSASLIVGQGGHIIRGLAPKARLFVANVFGSDGGAKPEAIRDALTWLVAEGVEVIAIPLGSDVEHPEIVEQIDRAVRFDIWVLAAAGNDYPAPLAFPARDLQVIAVGAADWRGTLRPNCCREPRLDLIAPGWGVPAPISGERLHCADGSSVACALAAGAAALARGYAEKRENRADPITILCGPKTTQRKGDSYAA